MIIYFEKSKMSCEKLAQNRGYLGQSICRKHTVVLNAKVKLILFVQLFAEITFIRKKTNFAKRKCEEGFRVCIVLVFAKNTMLGSWNPGGLSAKLKITLSFDHLLINMRTEVYLACF